MRGGSLHRRPESAGVMSRELPARRAQQITATVLFADVVGFSRLSAQDGPERAYLAVTQLLRLLDAIARRHGGSVDKYQGDKLMAVFGYPVPLEHPERAAVSAALEMRQPVADYNPESGLAIPLETHMGINTGELVGGDIRGPVVREFHVLGDAVNVAARLNSKAPVGEIWAGERTQAVTEDAFVWKPLDALLFKGKSRRVAAFALEAARGRGARDRLGFGQRLVAELIGREAPLAALRERVAGLARGRGGALLLIGEEGSGKSRLLAALGEAPECEGLRILQARASPAEREAEIEEARVFSAAGEGPLLAVFEDLQWLSARAEARLVRLIAVARELPVLLIATARPGLIARRLATEIGSAGFEGPAQLELPRLDRAAAVSLVRAALGAAADDETVELVTERGGGLPGPLLQAAFLAPALRSEREQAKHRAERTSEAERRRAVVLFADITGFTMMTERVGAEAAYPVVAALLEILGQVASSHGGTVDHYLGDCVMALFGVPRALEDAPRAALNASIEMRRRIREFREEHALPTIDVHIGVGTGHGIAGDISGPLIREFAVMGDHVDRADVLTHAAESGEIMVDEATWRAAREIFEFSESEARQLAGAAEPQPTWELTSTAPRLHRARIGGAERRVFSELVGRESELAQLRGLLDALAKGQGGVASLVAEAGLGKSRL